MKHHLSKKVRFTKTKIEILILVVVASIVIFLPLYARTGTYPLAIINGNSMYPHLQNGDLVYYSATNVENIPNGTVIVFVSGRHRRPFVRWLG